MVFYIYTQGEHQLHMNDLVSIIIPIYNVEKYLNQCIDSVLSQDYSNIEVILVDDGSTDNCGLICDNYSSKDSRIVVIHKSNGGLSSARNAGLDIAQGKYIAFLDSDDYVTTNYISEMIKLSQEDDTIDLVISSYYNVYENTNAKDEIKNNVSLSSYNKISYTNGDTLIKERFGNSRIPYTLTWNKLYKSTLFDNIRYKEGLVHEDEFIYRSIMEQCNKIAIINEPLTFHRIRSGSIMTNYSVHNLECNLQWMQLEIEYYKTHNLTKPLHILKHMMCHEYVSHKKLMDSNLKKEYGNCIKETMKDIVFSKNFSIKTRIHYLIELVSLH